MTLSWPALWGYPLPAEQPGLSILPVIAVVILLVMINVAANKALPGYYLFWTIGGSVVMITLGLLDGSSWRDMGVSPSTWISGIVWGGACMLLIFIVYAVGATWKRTKAAFADQEIASMSSPRYFWQSLVELPVGTVLFEEIAFRAVLWSMLARRYGVVWATIISSVLFGLWHILPSLDLHIRNQSLASKGGGWWPRTVAIGGSIITTTIGGVVFCLLRMVSGSLIAPMGLHWATNGWGYIFARRAARRSRKALE